MYYDSNLRWQDSYGIQWAHQDHLRQGTDYKTVPFAHNNHGYKALR